jgi:hypothetical protein
LHGFLEIFEEGQKVKDMVKKKLYTLIVNLDQNELGHFDTTNKDK